MLNPTFQPFPKFQTLPFTSAMKYNNQGYFAMEQVSLTEIENIPEASAEEPAKPGGHLLSQSHASM